MNITQEQLNDLQTTLFEITKVIKNICEENNLEYFLIYGSMLGAIRHEDFIPWDDDMDIGMNRKDYDKFTEIVNSKKYDGYFLQTIENQKYYGWPFGKFMKLGTEYIEGSYINYEKENGIFVDIFPFDNAPDDPSQQKKHLSTQTNLKRFILMKSGYVFNDNLSRVKLIRNAVLKIILRFVPRTYLLNKLDKVQRQYNNKETKYMTNFGDCYLYDKELITELKLYPFRDTHFSGPKYYDRYLTQVYGDYMQLPPVEERVPIHGIVSLKF